jgi:TRAP-type mannitol/chloroaromatic compound transport system substrate-binding protein
VGQAHDEAGQRAYEHFAYTANLITEASGGQLVCRPNPAGAIAPTTEELDAVNAGTIDYARTATAYWAGIWPAASHFTFTVAGLTPMEQMAWWVSGGGKELAEEMVQDYNVKIFCGQFRTPEVFLHTTKPLESVDDIDGLKIRTAGDDGTIFSRMGAAVTMLPGGEVYEALQRGVIDAAQLTGPAGNWDLALQEVADYVYLSPVRQPAETVHYIVNEDKWNALPDSLKALVNEIFFSQAVAWYPQVMELDLDAVKKFKDYGNIVEPPPQDLVDEMVRQADIFYDEKSAEDAFFAEVYDAIRQYRQDVREAWPRL